MSEWEGLACILGEKPAGPGENGMTETCGSFSLYSSPQKPPVSSSELEGFLGLCSAVGEGRRKSDFLILKERQLELELET